MLQEIEIPPSTAPIPERVEALLAEADRRIDELFETEKNRPMPKYLPSDPLSLYRALEFVTQKDLPLGKVFCELGSGYGVATCMASLLGYEAYGIEIEPFLVEESRKLAEDQGIEVEILPTSYLPEGFDTFRTVGGTGLIVPDHHSDEGLGDYFAPSFEGMPHTTDEVAVYFVYPWPREQHLMERLFEALACEGAILLLHYGDTEVRAYRRVGEEERDEEDEDFDEDEDALEEDENADGDDDDEENNWD